MNEQDKQLLLKDLCGLLPYGFYAEIVDIFGYTSKIHISVDTLPDLDKSILLRCKPYLRPLSSMTEEEREYMEELSEFHCTPDKAMRKIDFYLEHHLDFRGLIPMGLASEALEGMYKKQ